MNKYLAFVKISINETFRHYGKFYGRLFLYLLILIIFSQVWGVIVSEHGDKAPYTLYQYVWYVMVTEWIVMSSDRVYIRYEQDTRNGDIAYFLTRPLSYYAMRHFQGLGASLANAVIYFCFGFLIAYKLSGGLPADISIFPFLIVSGLLAILLDQIFQSIVGLTALWFQDASGIFLMYQKSMFVFGGLFFPLDIYPDWLRQIALHTPFGAMIYGTASLVRNPDPVLAMKSIGILCCWCLAGYALAGLVFSRCLRRIEVNGG